MERALHKVTIDLDALTHNLGQARKLAGPGAKIMAVVKADAYGHGLLRCGLHLAACGADALGVMNLDEAVRLRQAGLALPIYILAGIEADQADEIIARRLTPFVYERGLLEPLNDAARRRNASLKIILKVDTGMGRLGPQSDYWRDFFSAAAGMDRLSVIGLATHLATADEEDRAHTDGQLELYDEALALAAACGLTGLNRNTAANSAGLLAHPPQPSPSGSPRPDALRSLPGRTPAGSGRPAPGHDFFGQESFRSSPCRRATRSATAGRTRFPGPRLRRTCRWGTLRDTIACFRAGPLDWPEASGCRRSGAFV